MEMKLFSFPKERETSTIMNPVISIKSQPINKTIREGKKPANEVVTGSASMPIPRAMPETRKIAPKKRFILFDSTETHFSMSGSAAPLFWVLK
jgi:hypothetical protein